MSFELELLRLDGEGKATVVDRELCPLDLSLAKMKAQQTLDEKRKNGGMIDAVRILDDLGQEIFLYQDSGTQGLAATAT